MKYQHNTVNASELIKAAEQLKTVPRLGWLLKGVKRPESVADHSYAVALISMVVADIYQLDTLHMLRLAILHDISESLVGDIQPEDLSKQKKHKLEKRAFMALTSKLPYRVKRMYRKTFDEFIKNESKEARLVAQIDKLEMALQAENYRKKGYKELDEFFKTAEKKVKDQRLIEIMRYLLLRSS
ncbi:MAG: HD domain-containing protein [Conexivisphaerales archaeon]